MRNKSQGISFKKVLLFIVLVSNYSVVLAVGNAIISAPVQKASFIENKKQWNNKIKYLTHSSDGLNIFLEKDCFTMVKYSKQTADSLHHKEKKGALPVHAFQQKFLNTNNQCAIIPENKASYYYNYFIGADSSKWSSNVGVYEKVLYNNIYKNIHLSAYLKEGKFKYDFIIMPDGNPSEIKFRIDGANNISTTNNTLRIETSVGDIIQEKPYSYQLINGERKEIKVEFLYNKKDNTITFLIKGHYQKNLALIIDPTIIAATYSGSKVETYGHSASYDNSGNIYTGGECFGSGYPAELGYQKDFRGKTDIVISKLNPDGSQLIWATYIGGFGEEMPNSLFVNNKEELYVLGCTNSSDFPTTANCVDNSVSNNDIIITHLNKSGNALIGSTLIGGSNNDGSFLSDTSSMHDAMRGEIIVDANNNAYVASYTDSPDFPVSSNAYDQSYNGNTDGCLFKINGNMTSLLWSSYIGGNDIDVTYGLRLSKDNEIYFTGYTTSSNLPTTPNSYQPIFNGKKDGYLGILTNNGSILKACSYTGTSDDDTSYFIDLDINGNPYIYGISKGNMPVIGQVYSNPNTRNFIQKFSKNLDQIEFSTTFGGNSYLEPSAFMVDSCLNIYLSGFGADENYPTYEALLDYSSDNSCYFMVLSRNAETLLFGSFYYGWHVDGGTSRFDPKGIIYQSICMGWRDAQTTNNAYDKTGTLNYNIFVVKIDFEQQVKAIISVDTPKICLGNNVVFHNESIGKQYIWDFGDGSPNSSEKEPKHNYKNPGKYKITFIVSDNRKCIMGDTAFLEVEILESPIINIGNDTTVCSVKGMTLDAGNGESYLWSTGETTQKISLSTPGTYWVRVNTKDQCPAQDTIKVFQQNIQYMTISNTNFCTFSVLKVNTLGEKVNLLWSTGETSPEITVNTSGQYKVHISNDFCNKDDSIKVNISSIDIELNLGNDTTLCEGEKITIGSDKNYNSYQWSNGYTSKTIDVKSTGRYILKIQESDCEKSDTINVSFLANPIPQLGKDTILCNQSSYTLNAGNHPYEIQWWNGSNEKTIEINKNGNYKLTLKNEQCIGVDSINISFMATPLIELGPDTVLCPQTSLQLNAGSDDFNYTWNDGSNKNYLEINTKGKYYVFAGQAECSSSDTININYHPSIEWDKEIYLCNFRNASLDAKIENAFYYWSTGETTQKISIEQEGNYWVNVEIGECRISDTTLIFGKQGVGIIYFPNAFTPNNDGLNDYFKGIDEDGVINYHLMIFNRWGELLYETYNIKDAWNGSYKGSIVQEEVYVWKLDFTDRCSGGKTHSKIGHVSVIK